MEVAYTNIMTKEPRAYRVVFRNVVNVEDSKIIRAFSIEELLTQLKVSDGFHWHEEIQMYWDRDENVRIYSIAPIIAL